MMQCSVEAAKVVTRLNLDVVFKSIRPLGKHGGGRGYLQRGCGRASLKWLMRKGDNERTS